ncbi:uncharacterized protein LOC130218066 [Danio aesculapii]|uniref:uncharacterized protein LOC130218066 n=1 Tax=Danio aesculapii TaxID=1142201 RepID=UPI0024C0D09B|nr:uncharacterized protein LOC130218066 [Danio aesculapii]
MQISGISFIILLIPISTAYEIKCEGDSIELSCLESSIKDKVNALWKKSSGERVIWNYYGDSNKGDSFTNRTVKLNDDFSLSIDGCAQSDQGIYILCINGEPRCEIKLLVKASKQCNKPKTTTAQSTSPTTHEKSRQDDLQNESSLPKISITGVCVATCLLSLVVLWAVLIMMLNAPARGICVTSDELNLARGVRETSRSAGRAHGAASS